MKQKNKLVESIVKGIQEKKGTDIVIVDLRGIDGTICDYFIICQGNSPTQIDAITDSVEETARIEAGEKPGLHRYSGTHLPARDEKLLQSGRSVGRCKSYTSAEY